MESQEKQTANINGPAIAIIGMAFEFPRGATSEGSFWEMMCAGRSASTDIPPDRLNINAFHDFGDVHPSTGMFSARGGHFLEENLAAFDAPFFSITPNEATCMDPQHRRMLETAYHALEDGESSQFRRYLMSENLRGFCSWDYVGPVRRDRYISLYGMLHQRLCQHLTTRL
jgi:hypothetical protein